MAGAVDPTHLNELKTLEDKYWWHVAKRQLVVEILKKQFPAPGKLIEGGIGSSRNLIEFRDMGYDVAGFDVMEEAVVLGRQRGLDDVHQLDLAESWPIDAESVRAVVLLDVLEHLADPVQVLRNAAGVLQPDGGIIVTVPAYPWLYSNWDKSLGHFRRYTARELQSHADQAGLQTRWMAHWNAFTLPAAVAVRGLDRIRPRGGAPDFPRVSPMMNSVLLSLARAERSLLRLVKVPVGLSIVGVLTK